MLLLLLNYQGFFFIRDIIPKIYGNDIGFSFDYKIILLIFIILCYIILLLLLLLSCCRDALYMHLFFQFIDYGVLLFLSLMELG